MAPDRFASVVDRLVAAIRVVPRPVVLIDGRSGSGKSTLAAVLAPALDASLVHLEDIYPGWDGLEQGRLHLEERVLRAAKPRWQGWDWVDGRPADWHDVEPMAPLVVEGVGALSRAARELATFGVWLELDDAERRTRALDRDGERYAPHWDRWAAQETAFLAAEQPMAFADAVVQTAPWTVRFTGRHIRSSGEHRG